MRWAIRISPSASRDITRVLEWTREKFGKRQQQKYARLIKQAINQIAIDPFRHPSKAPFESRPDVRIFRLSSTGQSARHTLIFRVDLALHAVEIGRLLHDAMELESNVPDEFKSNN